jgi:hypothetical protein
LYLFSILTGVKIPVFILKVTRGYDVIPDSIRNPGDMATIWIPAKNMPE